MPNPVSCACLYVRAGGMYLSHIMSTTGATVQLRGQGSVQMEGPDPLHVYVAAPTQRQIDEARG